MSNIYKSLATLNDIDAGQFLYVKSPYGWYYISIFKGIEVRNNTDTRDIELHTYCDLCSDDNYVYFAKECSTLLETVSYFVEIGTATEEQKKSLHDAIIKKYKDNHPTWDKYFTDSVYDEIQDWFAYMCGITFDEENGYPDFVCDFTNYAWNVLCKETGNYEACTDYVEPEMVNKQEFIAKVKRWLELETDWNMKYIETGRNDNYGKIDELVKYLEE